MDLAADHLVAISLFGLILWWQELNETDLMAGIYGRMLVPLQLIFPRAIGESDRALIDRSRCFLFSTFIKSI
jgi:hypothetical protein